jgi:hypothetical protein
MQTLAAAAGRPWLLDSTVVVPSSSSAREVDPAVTPKTLVTPRNLAIEALAGLP